METDKSNEKRSKKRTSQPENENEKAVKKTNDKEEMDDGSDSDQFYEDPYEDDYEEELIEGTDKIDIDEDEMEDGEKKVHFNDEEEDDESKIPTKVFKPGQDKLGPDEVLEYDSSAYDMLHPLKVEWPCLSFDIIPDKLGYQRAKFPHTVYFAAGTQAEGRDNNRIVLMKASSLHKTKHDDDSDYSDDDDDLDDDPELEFKTIAHPGGVNRLRMMPQEPNVIATWADTGKVHLWNTSQFIKALDKPPSGKLGPTAPIKTLAGHPTEGFALSWSTVKEGRLLSGDCNKHIYLTEMLENGSGWAQEMVPFSGHTKSVEDLQWSPTEPEVFASCSVDKTIKIWDTRMKKSSARSFQAADTDVNVISWNKKVAYLLISGADDGSFRVWDLRSLKSATSQCESVGHFKWHTDQITSVEWDPNDDSVLAVAGADNQVTIWDLAVEKDTETEATDSGNSEEFPPQLLFVHQGQSDVKEVHWHPQIPNMLISTAEDGFNLFKPNITE